MRHFRGNLAREFFIHKSVMWMIGIWPLDSRGCRFNIRWFFGMLAEMSMGIPALLECLKPQSEFGSTINNLFLTLICVLSFLKNLLFRLRSARLERNLIAASKDWAFPADNESYKLMRERAKLGKMISVALILAGYVCFTSFFISTLIHPWTSSRTSGKLIRHYLLPFGPVEGISDWEYRWVVLVQFLLACVVHARECVIDSFFFCITMHLCGQFDTLRMEFQDFRVKFYTDKEYKRVLRTLVQRHCELIDLVKNIEHTYHLIILTQAMMSVLLLGMSGLQLVTDLKRGDFLQAAKSAPFITFFVLQTIMYAHAGQTLLEESRAILHAMYDTGWQHLHPARTKDLVLIMTRSNMPFYVSGGKFFCMRYYAVYGMVKRVFTYVTFLQVTMTVE